VAGATAALKSFQASSPSVSGTSEEGGKDDEVSPVSLCTRGVDDAVGTHVDLVCTLLGEPVWVVVVNSSAHNRLWLDKKKRKGLRTRVCSLLHVASLVSAAQPSAVVLLVRDGFESRIEERLQEEFQATKMSESGSGPGLEEELLPSSSCNFQEVEDGEWVNIQLPSSKVSHWTSYWIRVGTQIRDIKCTENLVLKHVLAAGSFRDEDPSSSIGSSSCWAAIMRLQARHEEFDKLQQERKILNLDTTALVAVVSELTNGGAQQLLEMASEEREKQFPMMAKFVYEQVKLRFFNSPVCILHIWQCVAPG
jgi:hypothetical protein